MWPTNDEKFSASNDLNGINNIKADDNPILGLFVVYFRIISSCGWQPWMTNVIKPILDELFSQGSGGWRRIESRSWLDTASPCNQIEFIWQRQIWTSPSFVSFPPLFPPLFPPFALYPLFLVPTTQPCGDPAKLFCPACDHFTRSQLMWQKRHCTSYRKYIH